MKNSGRYFANEVNYDKVYWNKNISFPDSYGTYNFKIIEQDKKFYIFVDDIFPNLKYIGRAGSFESFEEALNILEEDLGSDFPSVKNKTNKTVKVMLIVLFWIAYFAINYFLYTFIHGGLNAIGIDDTSYDITGITALIYNAIAIILISKFKPFKNN